MIVNPERVKFINERLVNKPMDEAEMRHWLDLFHTWEERVDADEEPDDGRAHWVDFLRRRLWKGDIDAAQLAGAMRHHYVMDLWDKEHRMPQPHEAPRDGEKPPYFRE